MTIKATIIADSVGPAGIRLTTMQLRYPRFVHAELMTHRVFSRNASSSRAIPVERMIEDLRRDPAMPVFWGSNKPGMQAGNEIGTTDLESARALWLAARDQMIVAAEALIKGFGLHKQIANRILEPWAHINVVVTATDWMNFYSLRCHPDAQPEMRALAEAMRDAHEASTPRRLEPGEWHLPYVGETDWADARMVRKRGRITRDEPSYGELVYEVLLPVSVARCARVSYLTHDGRETTVEEDVALHDRLVSSIPIHASPAEHQATPDILKTHWDEGGNESHEWAEESLHGNFDGWIQNRKLIEQRLGI